VYLLELCLLFDYFGVVVCGEGDFGCFVVWYW